MKNNIFFAIPLMATAFAAQGAMAQTAAVARGAELVATCTGCHTPRDANGDQGAADASNPSYLAGNEVGGWWAPSLRAGGESAFGIAAWTQEDIAEYLSTGRNRLASVGGTMKGVVENATSSMSADDVNAIAAYLKTLPAIDDPRAANPDEPAATTAKLTAAVDLTLGERLYIDNCGACHFVDGQGGARIFPVLDGASIVNAPVAGGLIETILFGAETPSTEGGPSKNLMPAFGDRLSDEEVAALATFVRQAWTNDAGPVTEDDVADLR